MILTISNDVQMFDWPARHCDPIGSFSVKSVYKLAVQIQNKKLGRDASTSTAVAASDENGSLWTMVQDMAAEISK